MIEVGAEAPDFSLPDQDGNTVSLEQLRGRRVLLAFFPAVFSPVCTDQFQIYERDLLPEREAEDLTVLGISVDSSFAQNAFREQLGVGITLLSDFQPRGQVASSYGAFIESRGHTNRSLVLIDAEGRVEWVHETPTPLEIPPAQVILEALSR